MVCAAADIRRDKIEAVGGESARHKIDIAVVGRTAAGDGVEHIAAELLKTFIINDARAGGARRRYRISIQRHEYLHGSRVRRVFHRASYLRVVEQTGHE